MVPASLLHRQPRLGAVQRLDLAFLIDRENDGVVRRIDVQPTISLSLAANCGSLDNLNWRTRCGRRAMGAPDALHRADADSAAFAIAEPVQWLAVGGGPANVSATTRSATSGPNGGMREGRVLSRQAPPRPRPETVPASARSPSWLSPWPA